MDEGNRLGGATQPSSNPSSFSRGRGNRGQRPPVSGKRHRRLRDDVAHRHGDRGELRGSFPRHLGDYRRRRRHGPAAVPRPGADPRGSKHLRIHESGQHLDPLYRGRNRAQPVSGPLSDAGHHGGQPGPLRVHRPQDAPSDVYGSLLGRVSTRMQCPTGWAGLGRCESSRTTSSCTPAACITIRRWTGCSTSCAVRRFPPPTSSG